MSDLDTQATLETPASTGIESPTSMDSTIGDAWKEISKGLQEPAQTVARDSTGKFTAQTAPKVETPLETPAETPEVVAETAQPEQVEQQPVIEAKKAPSSWKKEAAEAFNTLPPHVQDEVLRREGDFHKGIEGFKAAADTGRKFEQAIAPYMQTIQKLGVSPEIAVSALMKADHTLRYAPPAVKVAEIQRLAQIYGIDLGQQIDPNVTAMQTRIYELEQRDQQRELDQQTQTSASLNSEIDRFAAEPGHELFPKVRDHMASLLQGGQAKDLQEAYDQAVYANPQTRAEVLAKQQEEARKEALRKANDAKKAASVNVPQRGTTAAAAPKLSWEQQIRADAERLGLVRT